MESKNGVVIPAKAGIQMFSNYMAPVLSELQSLDSRLHENDNQKSKWQIRKGIKR
jgi:hypothetical protein